MYVDFFFLRVGKAKLRMKETGEEKGIQTSYSCNQEYLIFVY